MQLPIPPPENGPPPETPKKSHGKPPSKAPPKAPSGRAQHDQVQNIASQQHTPEPTARNDTSRDADTNYASDSSDEVKFVRWIKPEELAESERELLRMFRAQHLGTDGDPRSPSAEHSHEKESVSTASVNSPPSDVRATPSDTNHSLNMGPVSHASVNSPPSNVHQPQQSGPVRQHYQPLPQQLSVIPATALHRVKLTHHMQKFRYYAVTKGRCAGIYYNCWDRIRVLTDGVPYAKYHGYPTYKQAYEVYFNAKQSNQIEIIRNPGDDDIFGPLDAAIQ